MLCAHATAVVLDPDTFHTAQVVPLQCDDHSVGVGVEGVPHQLLHSADRLAEPRQFFDVLPAGLQPQLDHDPSSSCVCAHRRRSVCLPRSGYCAEPAGVTRSGAVGGAGQDCSRLLRISGSGGASCLTFVTPGVFSPARLAEPLPRMADCPSCSVELSMLRASRREDRKRVPQYSSSHLS